MICAFSYFKLNLFLDELVLHYDGDKLVYDDYTLYIIIILKRDRISSQDTFGMNFAK